MTKITTIEVNERRHRVIVDRHELKRIVTAAVMFQIGLRETKATEVKVEFEDETEGSPAHRVGTRCVVEVIEDLRPDAGLRG